MDLKYISTCMCSFEKMRTQSIHKYYAYMDRVSEVIKLGSNEKFNSYGRVLREKTSLLDAVKSNRLVNLLVCSMRGARYIPQYVTQIFQLRNMLNTEENHRVIVSLAANRLMLDKNSSIKNELIKYAGTLHGQKETDISSWLSSNDSIIIIDPSIFSDAWRVSGEARKENVYILDGIFLMLYSSATILKRFVGNPIKTVKYLKSIFSLYLNLTKERAPSKLKLLYELACLSVFSRLVNASSVDGLFFTSNSHTTELLRAFLLQTKGCNKLVEILHGIMESIYENYFNEILTESKRKYGLIKANFIPQITGLPRLELIGDCFSYDDVAINSYINMRLQEFLKKYNSFEGYVQNGVESLSKYANFSDEPIVLTFYGGTGHDANYELSKPFYIEKWLLENIIQIRDKHNLNVSILYAPHPANRGIAFSDIEFFSQNNIAIEKDSVFCYFISDICISLMSSCLFESAYFGVKSFTPMLPDDGFYSRAYLDAINYPKENTAYQITSELENLLYSNNTVSSDLIEKALARFKLYDGSETFSSEHNRQTSSPYNEAF